MKQNDFSYLCTSIYAKSRLNRRQNEKLKNQSGMKHIGLAIALLFSALAAEAQIKVDGGPHLQNVTEDSFTGSMKPARSEGHNSPSYAMPTSKDSTVT